MYLTFLVLSILITEYVSRAAAALLVALTSVFHIRPSYLLLSVSTLRCLLP